jgi:cytochrome oxidase Cu insertion factor (SCO1/SenC/PrrC family)
MKATPHCSGLVRDRTELRQWGVGAILTLWFLVLPACNSAYNTTGAYDAVNQNDCLPAIKLIDQNSHEFMLSSLKGKPVLIDFIYTSCPGPCITLTQKMANIAQKLGDDMGEKATLVSLSIDPEHDGPQQMAEYAKKQAVDRKGWLFLTGEPTNVRGDESLPNEARTGRGRRRDARDRSVSHRSRWARAKRI